MSTLIVGGVVSLASFIIGVRLYKSYFVWGSYHDMLEQNESPTSRSMLIGKTMVVTGANSGIGKETIRELYAHGARVILACRNETESMKVIEQLRSQYPQSEGELVYKHLDLASLASVKHFAKQINAEETRLDTLINNAAVFGAPLDITIDGFEINIQVNHFAPALLTLLLLPKLKLCEEEKTSTAKVIMVSSTLHRSGHIDESLLGKIDSYKLAQLRSVGLSGKSIYANTKLTNLLFTRQLCLQKELIGDVKICLASPGFAWTRLHRYANKSKLVLLALMAPLFAMVLKSSKQGAQTIIGCAMAKQVQSDVFYQNCKINQQLLKTNVGNDNQLAERVFQLTMNALKDYIK